MSPDTTTDKTSGISQKVEESLLPIDVAAIAKNPLIRSGMARGERN
jgi:hypothetical protein